MRKVLDPADGSNEHTRQGAQNDCPGEGPGRTSFSDITIDTAGDGYNIEDEIGGTDCGAGKAENT